MFLLAAAAVLAVAFVLVERRAESTTVWQLLPSFLVIGIGAGLATSLTASVLHAMPAEAAGIASGIFNGAREVAGLLGITVIGAVLVARQDAVLRAGAVQPDAFLSGYRLGLLVAAALVAAGGVAAYVSLRHTPQPAPVQPLPELVAA